MDTTTKFADAEALKRFRDHGCELGRRMWMMGAVVGCKKCGTFQRIWRGWEKL